MNAQLPTLFSPISIGPARLRNRIFSTGHMTVMLEDGAPGDRMVAYHAARAAGGAGLIITEAARVHPTGESSRPGIRAYADACIPGYAKIAKACHTHGCAVFAQLTHPGRELGLASDGTHAVSYAPSAIPNERFHTMPRQMPQQLIDEIIEGFRGSAARLARAGVDGVEVVASHGYLLSQFMNPRINQRTDDYGGSFENRLRFTRACIAAVRDGAGPDLAVGIRLSGDEMEHDALDAPEMLSIAQALADDGVLDYLNVTAGSSAGLAGSTHIVPPMAYSVAYTAPLAAAIKARVKIPVLVAGRINQPQIAEDVLASGQADMCGMTRAMIADPLMPTKAQAGQLDDIRACVACNQACIGHMLAGFPISCIQHPETGRELEYGTLPPADPPRRVMVVGGGPAGMKAAAIAAARGHDVTLYESGKALGGQVVLAQALPGRAEFGGVTTNLAREVAQAGVTLHLNTKVTRTLIDTDAPEVVIIATGARPYAPPIEGADSAHVVDAWAVLQGANVGARVVLADWRCDWVGLGLAERLARNGCNVRLAVNGTMAGASIPQYARDKWLGDLHKLGVEILPYLRLFGVDEDTAYFQHTLSGEAVVLDGTDTLVTALGHQPCLDLADALEDWYGEIHLIGDCLSPRTAEEAILEGLKVAARI
ncbi:FAD-dependent oxidoreductase [Rhodobacteraceae bacterium KMM 6894]|nr:FAD-dependent oxidoreductase [Rhodobacteraceae bacterium KMM 6894]